MHPWAAAASWLLFLAANGTTKLDCFCTHVGDVYYQGGGLRLQYDGEENLWLTYCVYPRAYKLESTCENVERLSAAAPAVARLLQLQSPAEERARRCAGALEVVRAFSGGAAREFSVQQWCLIADHLVGSSSVVRLDDTDWNEETLVTDHLRRPVLSQLLRALRHIMKAVSARRGCADQHDWNFRQRHLNKSVENLKANRLNSYETAGAARRRTSCKPVGFPAGHTVSRATSGAQSTTKEGYAANTSLAPGANGRPHQCDPSWRR
ncbi:uncharacterized protein LOC126312905 isoform X2 [Schistocerca gregaria]|uniref:uncharacterized protein LOC126312905 isoform X2 n=1 Tax=Schistocerca gregaria TaxID=7010 RepID=UPI00211DDE50|nr:uncharacterized protein LOC126312905 isoform X2 [Schistocerca gregaria]